jgi:DNA-binding NarL/FixJ family response regulator
MEMPFLTWHLLIADDHQLLSEGLGEILGHVQGIKVDGMVNNGQEVLDFLEKHPVELILMDVNMPVMGGIECTKLVKSRYPQVKIVILTMYNEKSLFIEVLEAGADGCILKSNGSGEVLSAIRRVMENKLYFDGFQQIASSPYGQRLLNNKLSEREIEVIRLVVKGKTSQEIADQLCISENTVKTHRKNILHKLQLSNSYQLTLYAFHNRLI